MIFKKRGVKMVNFLSIITALTLNIIPRWVHNAMNEIKRYLKVNQFTFWASQFRITFTLINVFIILSNILTCPTPGLQVEYIWAVPRETNSMWPLRSVSYLIRTDGLILECIWAIPRENQQYGLCVMNRHRSDCAVHAG